MIEIILDFCAHCGVLCESGQGLEINPRCLNCHGPLKERKHRAQGVFSEEDAVKLQNPLMYVSDYTGNQSDDD